MARQPSGTTDLDLTLTATTGREHLPFLRKNLRAAHNILRPPLRELTVALVGDARMSRLHQQFMGIAGPTDVLTFPHEPGPRGKALAGDVVICVPQARRQARPRGIPVRVELLLYAVHGVLHLCGFDDRTDRQFRLMHRREDEILSQLGFGPVFHDDDDRARPSRRTQRTRLAGSREEAAR